MRTALVRLFYVLHLDGLMSGLPTILHRATAVRLSRYHQCQINFFPQGEGGITVVGPPRSFFIDPTSHLKSATYVDSHGGVTIGRCFHVGRNLTILSSNHNYEGGNSIPYDRELIRRPVVIHDFVWCGANVTILPGVELGEGVVVGAGSVVTKSFPAGSIIGGNPARLLKMRDMVRFETLKNQGRFY